jgi:membrane protein implicated in regulation of membrane protease activity
MTGRAVGFGVAALGVVLVVVGLLMASGWLSWFGRLPGDVRVERENVRLYVPITSMLLLSVVITAASYLVRRFVR